MSLALRLRDYASVAVDVVHALAPVSLALALLVVALVSALARVCHARATLARAGVGAVPWRPKMLWTVYQKSARSLLARVEGRFVKTTRGDGGGRRAFGAVVGTCPFVHIGEAKLARDVLRGTTTKAPLYHAFEAFSGTGIFTAEGGDWERKRAEVLRAFAVVGLASLRDRAVDESKRIVDELKSALKLVTNDGMEVLMLPALQRLALRVTFGYLTGKSLDEACDEIGQDRIACEAEYLAAATTLRHLIPARARSIWIFSDLLYGLTPVGRLEARNIRATRSLSSLALRVAKDDSPLGILRQGEAHLRERSVDVDGDKFPKGLLDEATTLLFAGHDTQSATLSWGLLRLVEHVNIQNDLRASLKNGLVVESLGLRANIKPPKKKSSGAATTPAWATSAFAPMLESVIRETLRLHPVAPLVVRMLTSNVKSDGMKISRGCAVGVWLSSVHRDPAVWDDAETFKPKRWLDASLHMRSASVESASDEGNGSNNNSPSGKEDHKHGAERGLKRKGVGYMPFAHGPRSCVGQHLAQVTMRVALAHLIEAFEFSASVTTDAATPSVGFTVTPATGAPMTLRNAP